MREKNERIRYLLLLICCVLIPSLAYAQTELSGMGDEMMLFQEIPSVYSASKYEQKVTEAPSSVSIITSEEIKKFGYRDLGEILQSVRGFYVTNDRNYKFLGVRGFGLPSDYSNRILLLVDGIRTNDNIYDAPLIGREFPLEIDLIERIEVVRGPSSSLYGSNAFFGVINVITKTGRSYKGVELSGEAGNFNSYKNRISYGNRFQNGIEALLSASYYESQGHDNLDYSETYKANPWSCEDSDPANCSRLQDMWPADTVASGLDHERYANFFAEIKYKDLAIQGNYHSRKKGIPTATWGTIFNHDANSTIDTRSWLDVKYEHTFEGRLSVSGRLNYNYYKYEGKYPYAGDTSAGDADVVTGNDFAEGKWFHGDIQLTRPLSDKHLVTLGGSFQVNQKQVQRSEFTGASDWGELDDSRHNDIWAMFIQDEFTVTEEFIINAGLRYDNYKAFGSTTNPRVALIYNPFQKTTFKAIYGRAFRAPSVYELYYDDGKVTAKANNDLKPETIDTYELVYEQYMGDHLRGTVTGFYYTMKDLIKQETDPADGLLVSSNTDDVEAAGAAFDLEGKTASGLEGRLSYSYQKTKDHKTGRILTNSPRHVAKANVIIPILKEKIFLGIEELYTSRRTTLFRERQEGLPASLRETGYPSDQYAGSFFLTNMTLYTKKLLGNLEASASVYNLFNKKYGDPGAGEHFQDTVEQDGRTARVKITYAF